MAVVPSEPALAAPSLSRGAPPVLMGVEKITWADVSSVGETGVFSGLVLLAAFRFFSEFGMVFGGVIDSGRRGGRDDRCFCRFEQYTGVDDVAGARAQYAGARYSGWGN